MGLKIGITTNVVDSARYYKGVANYVKNLVINLSKINTNHNFYLIHFQEGSDEIYQLGLNEVVIRQKLLFQISNRFVSFKVREILKDFDIIHITTPTISEFALCSAPAKKVLTVHGTDLYVPPKYRAKLHTEPKDWFIQNLKSIMLPKLKDTISMYVTASLFLKRELVENLKIPAERVEVIPFAASKIFKPKEFQKSMDFILSDTPVPSLIKIYHTLKKKGVKHKLVVFGYRAYGYEMAKEMAANLGIQNDVIFAGHLPQADLVRLYNTADVYVRTPMYEGFGLPPLEAMACGCPVVTTNVGSLPEVVGDAGILKNRDDIEGLVNAIYEVLTNEGLSQDLVKRGLERAKMFSWEKTAKETIKVYEEVHDS